MDHEPRPSGSSGRISGVNLSGVDDDVESKTVSRTGDIGDWALYNDGCGGVRGFRSPADNAIESVFPLSTDLIESKEVGFQVNPKALPQSLEYILCLVHLAVFGIFGVLTRYMLQRLFGPGGAGVTSDQSILYIGLPSNIVGSFLMGWWGVVFKGDISHVSEYLAIGLTSGYLGSLSTFSGWNQKMLGLSVDGKWLLVVLGFCTGLFLSSHSIIFGVECAKGFKRVLKRTNAGSGSGSWRVDSLRRHVSVGFVLILVFGLLLGVSGALVHNEFHDGGARPQLWLGCIVAPLGVWIRWFLARLNGRGLGKEGHLKWLPFGTLIANVSAACAMAALSTVKETVSGKSCDTVATGLQFGLMGCLSTVPTFIAEFNAMRGSDHPWRAYAYAITTLGLSFGFGTLLYSLPHWARGYH